MNDWKKLITTKVEGTKKTTTLTTELISGIAPAGGRIKI